MSLLGFALLVCGMLLLWRIGDLFSMNAVVIAFQVLAVLLMIWARATLGVRSFQGACYARPCAAFIKGRSDRR